MLVMRRPKVDKMKRQMFQYLWIIGVTAWACFRIFAVETWLAKYGVNTLVFAIVEVGSSFPYAVGTARCVTNLIDRRQRAAVIWGIIGLLGFIAPDVYMLTAGKSMPPETYGIIIGVFVVISVFSGIGLIRKYRQSRVS